MLRISKYMPFRLNILSSFMMLFFSGVLFGQQELKQLDQEAFEALEKNDGSVFDKANTLLERSLKDKPSIYTINAYTILGIINKDKGYYTTSLDYYLKALNVSEKINDRPRTSACLNNIGSIYKIQGKHQKAIEYFNESLKLETDLNQPLQKSIRYYNIGECYKDLNSLDLALSFYNNSLIIEKKLGNVNGIIFAKLGIAEIYIKIKQFADAGLILSEVGKMLNNESVEERILWNLLMGKWNSAKGDDKAALGFIQQGLDLSRKFDNRIYLLEFLKEEIHFYEKQSNWMMASKKYKSFLKLNDELNSISIKNQLEDLTFNNEINKKELEIKYIKEQRDLAKKNGKMEKGIRVYQQKILLFFLVTLVLSVGLIIIGYRKLRENS